MLDDLRIRFVVRYQRHGSFVSAAPVDIVALAAVMKLCVIGEDVDAAAGDNEAED